MYICANAPREHTVGHTGGQQGVEWDDGAARDAPVRDAKRIQHLTEQPCGLLLRGRAAFADELNSYLGELAGLSSQL